MSIIEAIYSYLPAKRKHTPSGWTKFNAVCCPHNNSTADTRQRGGMIKSPDGVSYHCFNCGFKASYQQGRHLTRKMKQLLAWLGVPDDAVTKLALEALKIESNQASANIVALPVLETKSLPSDSVRITADNTIEDWMIPAIEYIYSRGLTLDDYDFYISEKEIPDRLIIPFYFENRVVGYTARKLGEGKPKYLSEQTPGYVFNLDQQLDDADYVIVVEGPMDAISVGGVAILGADIMDKQAMLIKRLGKKIIVLPDRDTDGSRTVARAIELGWGVSMPAWEDDIKDANDAMRRYGRLYTIWSIIHSHEVSELKIQLRMRKWFG
jgi:hypothetical protein